MEKWAQKLRQISASIQILLLGGFILPGCSNLLPQNLAKPTASVTVPVGEQSIAIYGSSNNQSGRVGTSLPGWLVVIVTDKSGKPVPDQKVVWSVTLGSASLSQTTSVTSIDGLATTGLTFGKEIGAVAVKAKIDGASTSVSFNETALVGLPTKISLVSGNSQIGAAGTALSSPLIVNVTDSYSNVVPNAQVDWGILTGGGSFSSAHTNTDNGGNASSILTLGNTTGASVVTATIHGTVSLVTFNEVISAGPPALISISSGDAQTANRGTLLPTAFVAKVTDASGNVSVGATVDWSVLTGGGSLSTASSLTDSSGLASATLTLGAVAGSNQVKALIDTTTTSVTFNATGTPLSFAKDFPFDTLNSSTIYGYDSTKVNFTGGVCALNAADQIDDDFTPTGFSGATLKGLVWDSGNHQLVLGSNGGCDGSMSDCAVVGSPYSGAISSRIMDIGGTSNGVWSTIAWKTPLPYGKELPGLASSEAAASYSLVSGSLMSGNVGLWHFDQNSWAGTVGEVIDSSGQANHGTASGGLGITNSGKFGNAAALSGVASQWVSVPITGSLRPNNVTLSLWAHSGPSASARFLAGVQNSGTNYSYALVADSSGNLNFSIYNGISVYNSPTQGSSIWDGNWHHFMGAYDGSSLHLYVDGVEIGTGTIVSTSISYSGRPFTVSLASDPFDGPIDEVAVWSRGLTANEAYQVYLRGASRVRYQVRSCALSDCSDGSYVGPDGTNSTYFSELGNGTTSFPSIAMSIGSNRYFQYKAMLDTKTSSVNNMALQLVTIGPTHYLENIPTVQNTNAIAYTTLTSFTETYGSNSCAGGSRYVLSPDNGVSWYYWTGGAWGVSNGTYGNASSANVIQTNLPSFVTTFGPGNLIWKGYLHSDGTQQCELDDLNIHGAN